MRLKEQRRINGEHCRREICKMKIIGLYNTPIKLEEEDLIAFDEKENLLIRAGDNLYQLCNKCSGRKIPDEDLYVNSIGLFSKNEDLHSLEWKTVEEFSSKKI